MNYVDGFVVPVEKKKLAQYRSMAKQSSKIWLEHGALDSMRASVTTFPTASAPRFRAA